MMRQINLLLVMIALVPLITSMGTFSGDGSGDRIPVPDKKFFAIFVDLMEVTAECRDVSIEGKTYLEGMKGEGTYTVSFDRIRQVEFRMQNNQLYGTVMLKDGNVLELVLNRERKAYGFTKYGTFQAKLASLKRMTLQ